MTIDHEARTIILEQPILRSHPYHPVLILYDTVDKAVRYVRVRSKEKIKLRRCPLRKKRQKHCQGESEKGRNTSIPRDMCEWVEG